MRVLKRLKPWTRACPLNPECIFCLSLSLSLSSRAQGHNGSLFLATRHYLVSDFFLALSRTIRRGETARTTTTAVAHLVDRARCIVYQIYRCGWADGRAEPSSTTVHARPSADRWAPSHNVLVAEESFIPRSAFLSRSLAPATLPFFSFFPSLSLALSPFFSLARRRHRACGKINGRGNDTNPK